MKKNSTPTCSQISCTAGDMNAKNSQLLLKTTLLLLIGILSFSNISAQYSGTITIPSGSFTGTSALATFIDSLNVQGLGGNLTVNVTASYTAPTDGYSLGSAALNSSMAGRTLTFNGNGNIITAPVGTRSVTTTVAFTGILDFIWCLRGTDNVRINNFTFLDPSSNATAAQQMEAAVAMFNFNATGTFDGCQSISITGNTFNMANNGGSAVIQAMPHTRFSNTTLGWGAIEDKHRDITITGNT
ncbi:MAG: hypothetical protein ACK5QP_14020, partial [Chitinophagales bacterium]